jgi:MFS family permease
MSPSGNSGSRYPRPRIAWYTVFVLMICYTLSYCDRQILAFLVGPMKQELHISDTQVGLLQGIAFVLVYTLAGLPIGALADRSSRRNLVALGVVLWSTMTSLSSVARSFVSLAIARMGVGIGEATLSPSAFSMISDSFPKERLGTALSVYTMGIQLGSGLALVIGGLIAQAVSHMPPVDLPMLGTIPAWRVTFLIVGAPGLAIALLMLTVREPPRQSMLLDSSGAVASLDFRALVDQLRLRWRTIVGLALIIGSQATCNYALLGWAPTFFDRIHHWPRSRTGLVLGLTTLGCGCLGLFVGGRLSDRWQRAGITDSALRVALLGLLGVGLTLAPAMLVPDAAWTVALLIPAVFFIGLPIGCGYAAVQLIFPNQARGLVSAIIIFAVALIGLGFGSLLPGLLNDHLFHDELRIGASISITVVLATVIGVGAVLATLAPYRRDYQTVHG